MLIMIFYEFLHFMKAEIYQMNKVQSPKNDKNDTSKISKIGFT